MIAEYTLTRNYMDADQKVRVVELNTTGDIAAAEYRYDNYAELQLHRHSFYEIVYVASGNGLHILNGVTSTVSKGYVFLVRPNDIHSFYPCDIKNSGGLKVVNCMFRRELLDKLQVQDEYAPQALRLLDAAQTPDLNQVLQAHPPKGSMLNQLEIIMQQLVMEYDMGVVGAELTMLLLLYQLLCCLFRIQLYGREENKLLSITNHDMAYTAISFMREHYARKLSLDVIAKHCMASKNHLAAVFKLVTGSTIFHFLEGIRMEKACEMLGATDEKVWIIAKNVGYADPSYFVKVFKGHIGKTPQAYRDQMR